MQDSITSLTKSDVSVANVVERNGLVAQKITDDLSWGQGSIMPPADYSQDDEMKLIKVVLDCIERVPDSEKAYSACTDGRLPVRLLNGEKIPVREQMVGADMVSAFYVAECLGPKFYKDPFAPVAERVAEVAEFLHENGLLPSSHVACGAAGGFEAIARNIISFSRRPSYQARLKALLPTGVYDDRLHDEMLYQSQMRLDNGYYSGLNGDTFLQAAEKFSGKRAIAELRDDGRGVHGHVEEAIMRIRLDGHAINETLVSEKTGGREVFGVNDLRMERLARLFSRGADQDYAIATMALEDFASSGHGTLAKNLNTYIVTKK